jgi:predicted DsbA family dithiol-disulfide isomerase
MQENNEKEIPLEEKIYEIIFESNPLNLAITKIKKMIYTNYAHDLTKYLKFSQTMKDFQNKIYQHFYNETFAR